MITVGWGAAALASQFSVMVSVTVAGTVVVDTREGSLVLGNLWERLLALLGTMEWSELCDGAEAPGAGCGSHTSDP